MNRIWFWLLSLLSASYVFGQPPLQSPISLVILHEKQYTFSTHLFDGTALNGRMALTARIKNTSSSPVTVTTVSMGVISVTTISYQGESKKVSTLPQNLRPSVTLQPSVFPVSFDDDPLAVASENLVTLAPQESLDVSISMINRFDFSDGTEPTESQYTPPGKGVYTMTFQYSYSGSDNDAPNVYHGTVSSAPIVVEAK